MTTRHPHKPVKREARKNLAIRRAPRPGRSVAAQIPGALEGVPLLKHVFTVIFGADVISESTIFRYSLDADEKTLEVLEEKASQFNNYLNILHSKGTLTPNILHKMKNSCITQIEMAGFPLPTPLPSTDLPEDERWFEYDRAPANTQNLFLVHL